MMKLGLSQPVLVFKNGNGWTKYTAQELTSFFLEYVRKRVEEEVFMGNKVTQAVITCPVLFSPMQREALKQAAMVAGFSKVVLANEPEAAGYAFCTMCPNDAFQGNALIVDWGGGTLDMALVYREEDHVRTRREHTAGDWRMGGEVFDEKLWDMVAQRVAVEKGIHLEEEDQIVHDKLLRKVRQAKEMLSRNTEHKFLLMSSSGPCYVVLKRGDFEKLIGDDIDKVSRLVQLLLNEIQDQSQKPELLLLGGETSQIPAIESRMKEVTGLECRKWQWSHEAVSLGAALLAYEDGSQLAWEDVKARDEEGKTALMKVAELGDIEAVNKLVVRGAEVNAKNNDGWTALMAAAENGYVEAIETLVRSGADVNAKDDDGRTALMIAAENDNVGVIETLVRSGAAVNDWDNNGWTALMLAGGVSRDVLIRCGARENPYVNKDFGEMVKIIEEAGEMPLL